MGSPQIRNVGTIGGNLGTASPAGDALPWLVALDAQVVLAGPDGSRSLPVADFLVGAKQTARAPTRSSTDPVPRVAGSPARRQGGSAQRDGDRGRERRDGGGHRDPPRPGRHGVGRPDPRATARGRGGGVAAVDWGCADLSGGRRGRLRGGLRRGCPRRSPTIAARPSTGATPSAVLAARSPSQAACPSE